jgi:predicted  nucleic acid-binding Zn-ribbon protein
MESKDNINTLNRHRLNFEKLNVNYELLNKSYIKLGERYQRLKDRNEILAKENSEFRKRLRDMEVKISGHIKRMELR